ncbi:magnesium/cobalt transporter CorA [Bifidobacterium tsurumiense]|uniref:Magnesium/cobalt transporter CorA n=2 Tax=Bifidobacterium tsurumiense TaxID=356829 RepID=A0A087EBH2_9BIFI|nr:magnesium/cobalt transporter CorA [Bifidobacterium tsurumiense]
MPMKTRKHHAIFHALRAENPRISYGSSAEHELELNFPLVGLQVSTCGLFLSVAYRNAVSACLSDSEMSRKAGERLMLRMFNSINGRVEQIEKPENGSWLCLSAPTDVELTSVSQLTGIDLADLRAPLDDEERSRVDVEDDYTMIIVDIPTVEERNGRDWYETIPLSIILTKDLLITVCMQDTPVLHPFMEGTIRGFNTFMRTRFILQILYRNATMYLRYLRIIDRETDKLEARLRHSMENREILMLLELSKTLVYFTTSLKSNEIVMEKLTFLPRIKRYQEDEDLLDDVITENKQAIEMANIYSGVLANMTDAFASIVSNNLNNVMRIFTIISITLSIPTLIFSMYGMNFQEGGMLGMPLSGSKWGFLIIILISVALAAVVTWMLTRSRLFK